MQKSKKPKMEMLGRNDNIWVGDDIEEEEEKDEDNDENKKRMEEKEAVDEEPAFMDNSGQFWNFACRIKDGRNLEEWCLKNGKLLIVKEEKFTRQFDCPIENCEFEAIFLKNISILYSRNDHNHPVENGKMAEEKNDEIAEIGRSDKAVPKRQYTQFQKHYRFYGQILDKEKLNKVIWENGLIGNGSNEIRFYYRCIQSNKNETDAGQNCKFRAIFDRKNHNFYITKLGHNHYLVLENGKKTLKIGNNYRDYQGKIWEFRKQIGSQISNQLFRTGFGFSHIKNRKQTINMYCRKKGPNWKCKFAGIYVKENGCLYTRGKHEHGMDGAKMEDEAPMRDYMDHLGKLWLFHSKIGKNISLEIFRTQFGFSSIHQKQKTLNLHCYRNGPNGKCKFAGIFLKENGCLYIRGKHEHLEKKSTPSKVDDNYVDQFGKLWKFEAKIGKNPSRDIFRTQFGLKFVRSSRTTWNMYCRKRGPNWKCKFAGIYVKENGCLYTRGKHEHEEAELKFT